MSINHLRTFRSHDEVAVRSLPAETCYELLTSESLGRVGLTSRRGVEILPVGYRLGPGPRIFVSTKLWGVLDRLAVAGAPCTFEVDHHGGASASGWSVRVEGTISRLDRAGRVALATLDGTLVAWPGYDDPTPAQLVPDEITGRSFLLPA